MQTENTYKSFNDNKQIEELQYNLLQYKVRLQDIKIEYDFFKVLIKAPIFQPQVINLFEKLEQFKIKISQIIKRVSDVLYKINSSIIQMDKKIESGDLVCNKFILNEYEELEQVIWDLYKDSSTFKADMIQYLQSIIKN